MDESLIKGFVKIDKKFKELKAVHEEMRTALVAELNKENLKTEENQYGKFTVATRTTYKYSDVVNKLADKVKVAKVKEEQSGKAKGTTTEHLKYTPV